MYKNISKITVSEDRCRPLRPITIYQNDAKSNIFEFTIYQGDKRFIIDDDTTFKLYMQAPDTLGKRQVEYLVQDDDQYITVVSDKVGVVQIALSELLVADYGQDIEIFLEAVSKTDETNTKRFHSFFINILPQDRSVTIETGRPVSQTPCQHHHECPSPLPRY